MNRKNNQYTIKSFKSTTSRGSPIKGGSRIKGRGVHRHISAFDIDGKHPLYFDEKLKER